MDVLQTLRLQRLATNATAGSTNIAGTVGTIIACRDLGSNITDVEEGSVVGVEVGSTVARGNMLPKVHLS